MQIKSGWIAEAKKINSPNFEDRPLNTSIDLVVIHCISLPPGEFGAKNIDDFFLNKLDISKHQYFKKISNLKVSSHFLIERTGKLKQFVSIEKKAWHAGVSSFENRENCNDFSIGIELEGTDDSKYEKNQYNTLIKLLTSLMRKYPNITKERVVGHSEIAPKRKTDPGIKFDWDYIKSKI